MASGFVEKECGGDTDVQRLDFARERNRDEHVAAATYERAQPLALGTEHERDTAGEIGIPHRRLRIAGCTVDPELRPLHLVEVARQVRHDRDRQVLDRSRGGARDGGGDDGRAVSRDNDAGRPGALGAAADRPEVVRIGDPVEHREQRPLGGGELVGVRVPEGLDPGDDALVVAGARKLGQLPLLALLRLRLGQPGLGPGGPLGRPDLEHLPAPPKRLPDGPAAVDELARHGIGMSR